MLKTIALIAISFFAVLGFLEIFVSILESISVSKYIVNDVNLTVSLSGKIDDVAFLLNTLLLQAEKINYKSAETKVIIKDCGLCESTYKEIYDFCMTNKNIYVEKCNEM